MTRERRDKMLTALHINVMFDIDFKIYICKNLYNTLNIEELF